MEAPVLTPLRPSDFFVDQITMPTIAIPDDLLEQTAADLAKGEIQFSSHVELSSEKATELSRSIDGSLNRISQEIWKDRLDQQQRKRTGNPFLPGSIVLGPVYSGLWTFSGEVVYERTRAGLA